MFNFVSAWNKRRRSKSHDLSDPWVYKPIELWHIEIPSPKKRWSSIVFTLKQMEEATDFFSDSNLVGEGGFGRVYKGKLRSGQAVAIKKMQLQKPNDGQREKEFRVEIDILSRIHHPNVITLIGYCADGNHKFIVYDYLPNGTLQDHLKSNIKWPARLKIALSAAKGLAYLHLGTNPILHRDFKSSNILLTDSLEAKISDFGFAKLMTEEHGTSQAIILGTFGYFDPEYTLTGNLTLKSDVYAFGVVLLELITGRKAAEFCKEDNLVIQMRHMKRRKLMKMIDCEVKGSGFIESVIMVWKLASKCVEIESAKRPTMEECVCELQRIVGEYF